MTNLQEQLGIMVRYNSSLVNKAKFIIEKFSKKEGQKR